MWLRLTMTDFFVGVLVGGLLGATLGTSLFFIVSSAPRLITNDELACDCEECR